MIMQDVILSVRHLTVKLKINSHIYPVVDDLSFDLKRGKTLALVGESGCGKSMTALALLQILPSPPALPIEGEVIYKEQNLLNMNPAQMRRIRGKHIAMIFQDPLSALNPVFSVGEQLLEVAKTHLHMEEEKAEAAVLKAFEDVNLPNPKGIMPLYPHQLSGGMLQRVMIAMALICSPDILIADEPTTALDVTIQSQILHLLKQLQEKKGMTILLITHDMGVVAENADEALVMYAGDCVEKADAYTLFDSPAHPYTQALFASRPDPRLTKKKLATIPGLVPRLHQLPSGCPYNPRCNYAFELCRGGKVPMFSLKQKGHLTKCWLYDKDLEWQLDEEAFV